MTGHDFHSVYPLFYASTPSELARSDPQLIARNKMSDLNYKNYSCGVPFVLILIHSNILG